MAHALTGANALKTTLHAIAADGYRVPADTNAFALARVMLEHIGNPDETLRDVLIYGTFCRWIEMRVLSGPQMHEILRTASDDDHLLHGIGGQDTDSVFTRTFSMLLIPLILEADRKSPFLPAEAFAMTLAQVCRYIAEETDYRGYVPGKGWADARAHAADALKALAESPHAGRDDLLILLRLIAALVATGRCVPVCDEDERMVGAFISLHGHALLSEEDILRWIAAFTEQPAADSVLEGLYRAVNVKRFFRSLYFRLSSTCECSPLLSAIVPYCA